MRRVARLLSLPALLPAAVALAALTPRAVRAQETPPTQEETTPRSALDGVYSTDQAARGEETFQQICYECHETSEFTARSFVRTWDGLAVYYLYKDIMTLMPDDNPGTLRSPDVVDVLAYMMKLNGLPAGDDDLPDDQEVLRSITWAIAEGGGS